MKNLNCKNKYTPNSLQTRNIRQNFTNAKKLHT